MFLEVEILNDMKEGTNNAFSGMKLTTKLWLVYLEIKLQENRCTLSI